VLEDFDEVAKGLASGAISRRKALRLSEELSETLRWVASRFSNCRAYCFDLTAAGVCGDLMYPAGYEHAEVSFDGGPVKPNTLRVTHVYRREHGEWTLVHRHGDGLPVDQGPH
jgi:hypothetical protein